MFKMKLIQSMRALPSVVCLSAFAFFAPVAIDQALESVGFESALVQKAEAKKEQEKRRLPGISESFFKKLGRVSDKASPPEKNGVTPAPDFKGALKELRDIEKGCKKCNEYELAQIYNYYGFVYYSLEDVDQAIKYYAKVVEQAPMISWGLQLQVMYTLAQLEFSQERYPQALKRLNAWMEYSKTVGPDVYYLRSSICYQMDDKKCAIDNIKHAVKMVEDKGQTAKEAWYNLQKALYLERESYKDSLPILVKLVRHYPKSSYYQQLASVYGMLEQSKNQLAMMDAAYIMGGLTSEQHLLNLAYLMLQNEYPYRAAKILDKGMKDKVVKRTERNLETLAKAYGQSQEKRKAIPLMKEAAKLAENGDLYGTVMSLYLDLDDSSNAIKAGRAAIKKGGLKREGEIHLNMGVAYIDMKEYAKAITSFKKAKKDKRTSRFADSWLQHAERELYRQEQLAKD